MNKEIELTDLLSELHKRSLGYLFGGPDSNWCKPDKSDKKCGCRKYQSCHLIPSELKDKKWDDLRESEKNIFRKVNCYRSTISDNPQKKLWLKENNPSFSGARKKKFSPLYEEQSSTYFADFKPCEIGGCVVPEMQNQSNENENSKSYWKELKLCPFYFRSKDDSHSDTIKNQYRFAQCYVSQKDVIKYLSKFKFITHAPLFREKKDSISYSQGDSFWYPFYSGYSYIQLLTLMNNDSGWKKFPFQLRWQITSIYRTELTERFELQSSEKYTNNIFEKCETNILPSKYGEQRFLDVCDGYASWTLLTWILIQRWKSLEKFSSESISESIEWSYQGGEKVFVELGFLGYGKELNKYFNLTMNNGQLIRNSSLKEDLELLGLIDEEANVTEKYEYLIEWLKKDINHHETGLKEFILDFKSDVQATNYEFDEVVNCFLIHSYKFLVEEREAMFNRILTLNPVIHIIVRAFLKIPIRWCYMPFYTDFIGQSYQTITPISGMIYIIEDSLSSKAYDPYIEDSNNQILIRIKALFPILQYVNYIEEKNFRDDSEKKVSNEIKIKCTSYGKIV